MAINKDLKDLVRQIKFHYSMKQGDIAAKLGVTESYLSDAINGRVPFSENLRSKIYEVFPDVNPKTTPQVVYCGQHVQHGDAINGDKVVEQIREKELTEEKVTIIEKVQCDLDEIKAELAKLSKSYAELMAQNTRLLDIIDNLTKNNK